MAETNTPLRCIVADDEPQICSLLKDALAQYGYHGRDVTDGATAAARKLVEGGWALLVSDVMMPLKTGVELVRELRQRGDDLPTVLMSSFLSDEVLTACSKLEHLAFLQKPFSLADLRRAIDGRSLHPVLKTESRIPHPESRSESGRGIRNPESGIRAAESRKGKSGRVLVILPAGSV